MSIPAAALKVLQNLGVNEKTASKALNVAKFAYDFGRDLNLTPDKLRAISKKTIGSRYPKKEMKSMPTAVIEKTRSRPPKVVEADDTAIISGEERLLDVVTTSALPAGSILFSGYLDVHLSSIIEAESAKYSKFKFLSVGLKWRPSCPTTTSGSIGLFASRDPNVDLNQSPSSLIQTFANVKNRVNGSVFSPLEWKLPNVKDFKEARFCETLGSTASTQNLMTTLGRLVAYAAAPLPASTTFGTLYVYYKVQFLDRTTANMIGPSLTVLTGAGSMSSAAPFGTAPTVNTLFDSVPYLLNYTASPQTLTLRPGSYALDIFFNGTGLGTSAVQTTVSAGSNTVLPHHATNGTTSQNNSYLIYGTDPIVVTANSSSTASITACSAWISAGPRLENYSGAATSSPVTYGLSTASTIVDKLGHVVHRPQSGFTEKESKESVETGGFVKVEEEFSIGGSFRDSREAREGSGSSSSSCSGVAKTLRR